MDLNLNLRDIVDATAEVAGGFDKFGPEQWTEVLTDSFGLYVRKIAKYAKQPVDRGAVVEFFRLIVDQADRDEDAALEEADAAAEAKVETKVESEVPAEAE
jgi:hypothetical protein